MIQAGRKLPAQPVVLGLQIFGHLLERLKMGGRITIPKGMVGNEVETALQEGAQCIKG